jgi:23S rRNA (pseudouridine1915-N3)-methyltransferase
MKINIISVGKIKEKFYRDALLEYQKRLSKYCTFQILEVADEKEPANVSDALIDQCKKREADRILKHIHPNAYVITLEILGEHLTSEALAKKIEQLQVTGTSHIQFVIGGSYGLHDSVIKKANMHLSFSKLTFPHQLMRVILSEQIYRAFRINNKEPYHK